MGEVLKDLKIIGKKVGKQVGKDYIVFPAADRGGRGSTPRRQRGGEPDPQLLVYMVIFCGHFPDGAEKFTQESIENETQRRVVPAPDVGSANFNAGP